MRSIKTILIISVVLLFQLSSFAQTDDDLTYEQAIQLVLKASGYDPGPINGVIGSKTTIALIQFQRDMGLSITGTADESTASAMLKLLKPSETPSTEPIYPNSQLFDSNTSILNNENSFPSLPGFPSTDPPVLIGSDGEYLGNINSNPYDPNSISNPYGQYGNPYSPESINNPYGQYGNPYSPDGVTNPYTTGGPRIFGSDGTYLGRINSNSYDPESISNPYGQYGNPYSPNSINNPYGTYGNPYSPNSVTNPYSTSSPSSIWDE